jgi:hypothetical protein
MTEIRLYDPQTKKVKRVENEKELKVMQKKFPRLLAVHFKFEK